MLKKVISGMQTGADFAGVFIAKNFGLQTGGSMPKGFKRLDGYRPEFAEVYGIIEHESASYVPRTYENVKNSDGTVRFAAKFNSAGEICTMKAINQYKKPYFDINLLNLPETEEFIDWLGKNNIEVLNVAGNSEKTFKDCCYITATFLTKVFLEMGFKNEKLE